MKSIFLRCLYAVMVSLLCGIAIPGFSFAGEEAPLYDIKVFNVSYVFDGRKYSEDVIFRIDNKSRSLSRLSNTNFVSVPVRVSNPEDWSDPERENKRYSESSVIKKAGKLIIPDPEFRETNISDLLHVLCKQAREADPEGTGVNLVMVLDHPPQRQGTNSTDKTEEGCSSDVPVITFDARFISFLEVIKIITSVSNLKYKPVGNAIMLYPSDGYGEPMVCRTYNVMPSVGDRISAESGGSWKKFFEELGVKWPPGSDVYHSEKEGLLMIKNTEHNMAVLEMTFGMLNVLSYSPKLHLFKAGGPEITVSDLLLMTPADDNCYIYRVLERDQGTGGILKDEFVPLSVTTNRIVL